MYQDKILDELLHWLLYMEGFNGRCAFLKLVISVLIIYLLYHNYGLWSFDSGFLEASKQDRTENKHQ